MRTDLHQIENLLAQFLGKAKKEMTDEGQLQFNCPMCAINKGLLTNDGKYNLEVNLKKLKYKCWVCSETDDMHGSLTKLIKLFGNNNLLSEYKALVKNIRESYLYYLPDGSVTSAVNQDIVLPEGYKRLYPSFSNKDAMEYLEGRGLTKEIIEKFRIGYIDNSRFSNFNKRIVLPSFDSYGDLNYWTSRSYGLSKQYINAEANKEEIIFNEYFLNWYADITLVEGPFDHLVVPNSIPLLGKVLKKNCKIFNTITKKLHGSINIFLDNDAEEDVYKVASLLNFGDFHGRIYKVNYPMDKKDGKKFDPSLIFQLYGKDGIRECLANKEKIAEYLLLN